MTKNKMYVQKTDLSEILNTVGDEAAARFIELGKRMEVLIRQPKTQSIRDELNEITYELYEIKQLAGLVSSR